MNTVELALIYLITGLSWLTVQFLTAKRPETRGESVVTCSAESEVELIVDKLLSRWFKAYTALYETLVVSPNSFENLVFWACAWILIGVFAMVAGYGV